MMVLVVSGVWLLLYYGLQPTKFLWPRDFPGKNTGVGCHFLLQGIFPTQGSNPCLLCIAGGFFTTEASGKPQSPYLRM